MAKDLEAALAAVGPQLRTLRQKRDITLTQLAETTGISVSTLSRLESGARRPTLELLLPLAEAYQVTLDELVDAPETGDPRVRQRPIERHGHTYIPLTRRPGGVQAYKQIIPPTPADFAMPQQTHEGYEWIYVLSGRIRLLLGDHDIVIHPGEAAEFDTRLPHLVLNPGTEPAEIINLFGPQGERVHVRARPQR
ncbi:helix-turn-helix domain-containing protein [Actinoplanes teichomyceticus]|uniref:XRE family transcriptional regulator n=1 Tax=Actinoplanes teichomyceticus TaxID=1867 RepID=A0A561WAC7_ACTTI|nr:XRE family transcriptional regulator [Actinoplanes teichomyceticus]TWG20812.1 XRE family transcriptional regulator [Actinoplanes teichomyceticus]GIF14467.1 hypothetical protein Ate01nite_44990 [Actinoplanes teichomyceticus]